MTYTACFHGGPRHGELLAIRAPLRTLHVAVHREGAGFDARMLDPDEPLVLNAIDEHRYHRMLRHGRRLCYEHEPFRRPQVEGVL